MSSNDLHEDYSRQTDARSFERAQSGLNVRGGLCRSGRAVILPRRQLSPDLAGDCCALLVLALFWTAPLR